MRDADLIGKARDDPEALGELYRRHAAAVHRWLARRVRDSVATELMAETFAQAALSLHRFRDERDGSALPWLIGIARNLLRRSLEDELIEARARRRLGIPTTSYELDYDDVLDHLVQGDLQEHVRAAFHTLPETQREALRLRVVEERSYDEVSAALGCSEVAARLRVMRALAQISKAVTNNASAERGLSGSEQPGQGARCTP